MFEAVFQWEKVPAQRQATGTLLAMVHSVLDSKLCDKLLELSYSVDSEK